MTEPTPADAPVRAPDSPATLSTTAKLAAVVEAHDARLAARAQLHPVAQVFDQVGDWIAVLGLTYACLGGRLSGELLLVGVCVVLGVQTGLRRGLGPKGMPGAGALALVGLGLAHALTSSGGSPGYLRLPSWYRRALRGAQHVAVAACAAWSLARLRWLVCLTCLALAALVLGGCPPSLPPVSGCTPFDTRCSPEGIPETCSSTQRWQHGATTPACSTWGPTITCCRTTSPYDNAVIAACVPRAACLPEPSAADAGAEGGAQ